MPIHTQVQNNELDDFPPPGPQQQQERGASFASDLTGDEQTLMTRYVISTILLHVQLGWTPTRLAASLSCSFFSYGFLGYGSSPFPLLV
jgi:hypothetical protein